MAVITVMSLFCTVTIAVTSMTSDHGFIMKCQSHIPIIQKHNKKYIGKHINTLIIIQKSESTSKGIHSCLIVYIRRQLVIGKQVSLWIN